MSDMANAFWNAFSNTMECSNTKRLLCTWHVDKAWRKHLNLIKDEKLRKQVYQKLCVLRTKKGIDIFTKMQDEFVKDRKKTKATKVFGEYFETNYSKRAKEWAGCYRQYTYINTNMYLESMHKTLKYSVYEKKKIRRLDHAISLIMQMFDTIFHDYFCGS